MTRRTTARGRHLAAALVAAAALTPLAAPTASAAPVATAACATAWGSTAKSQPALETGRLTAVRTGRHTCFDRLVIDMTGKAPGYDVRYVSTVYADGSGEPVPVAGGAKLQVVARKGTFSRPAMPSVAGYATFRDVKWAGSFEGQSTIGLGVRARLPMRVWTAYDATTDTSKIVVDVAHTW